MWPYMWQVLQWEKEHMYNVISNLIVELKEMAQCKKHWIEKENLCPMVKTLSIYTLRK